MKMKILALCFCIMAAPALLAQQLLTTSLPVMRLNISVQGTGRQPPVEFTVTQPDGTPTSATAQPINNGDRSGAVYYPSDFPNAGRHDGTYQWVARVDGKVVHQGTFQLKLVNKQWSVSAPF